MFLNYFFAWFNKIIASIRNIKKGNQAPIKGENEDFVTNTPNIRDVIAFPKTQSATCLLTEAPSKVDKDQLDELKIISTHKEE